ncbi:MAG: aminopeptidase [Opitutaceae bacterium]|nr:aminopeptidase [Verrucomicrobiales bacterium]
MPRYLIASAWLLVLIATTGCETARFYSQAIHGQAQITHRRVPIDRILKNQTTDPVLRQKLALVLDLRQFAETNLALPAGGHYLDYADLQRKFVVWNVHAAPEFSIKPKGWWYPFVGRLSYRGYFSEDDARAKSSELRGQGFDVFTGGVAAYSTLGWFTDPVLNTFTNRAESELAELIFHELSHHKVFVRGDTDFKEAFATAVAEEAVRRWFQSRSDQAGLAGYEKDLARKAEFIAIVLQARERLQTLYTNNATIPADTRAAQLRDERAEIIGQLRRDYVSLRERWGGKDDYDRWFSRPLNNAQLNTIATYYQLVPGFHALLVQNGGDLEKFYVATRKLGRLSEARRREVLNEPRITVAQ